jgi:hypothetical protein
MYLENIQILFPFIEEIVHLIEIDTYQREIEERKNKFEQKLFLLLITGRRNTMKEPENISIIYVLQLHFIVQFSL